MGINEVWLFLYSEEFETAIGRGLSEDVAADRAARNADERYAKWLQRFRTPALPKRMAVG